MKEVRIYKYKVDGKWYYCQGVDEAELRCILESKLDLPEGSLPRGNDQMSLHQVKKIAKSGKVCIKSHKFVKRKVFVRKYIDDRGSTRTIYRNKIVDVISRSDEFREEISKLLSMDYSVIGEKDNLDKMIDQKESALEKSRKFLQNTAGKSPKQIDKHVARVDRLPDEISNLKTRYKHQLYRNFNTGYYVCGDQNGYVTKDWPETVKAFEESYEKLRKNIIYSNMDRLMYNDNFTMIEALDSFVLNLRKNNEYVRYKK